MTRPLSLTDRLVLGLATGAGLGWLRPAPGTWGSLWGLPLSWLLLHLPHVGWQWAALALLYGIGIPLCSRAAELLQKKDPGCVVWDEIITVPIAFLGLTPTTFLRPEILLLGFACHRLFDITKVPPARQLERLPGGWGIMSDDVVAGCYAAICVRLWLYGMPPVLDRIAS